MIYRIFSEQMIESVGWAVLHSLWQSTLIAIILAVAFLFVSKKKAGLRYRLAYGGLIMAFSAFVATFFVYYLQPTTVVEISGTATAAGSADIVESTSWPAMSQYVERYLPVIFNVWLVGFILLCIKMLGGWIYVEQLKQRVSKEIPGRYHQLVSNIKASMGLRKKILVGLSDRVAVPIVAGYLKPIILIPIGLVNQMTDKEVEAILAHEIAHISRHDYLFNIIQSIIETMLYFNPAVWWISSSIRNTREHCCDDMAIKYCRDQVLYARALVKAEELKEIVKVRRPFALSLLGQKENLLLRIKRILQQPEKNAIAMEKILMSAGLLLCMVFFNIDHKKQVDAVSQESTEQEMIFNSLLPTVTVRDSMPAKMIERITRKENDKEVEATYENGVLTKLKINGESIPEEKRGDYAREIEQLEQERSTSTFNFNFDGMESLHELENLKHLEKLRSLENMRFEFPEIPDMEGFNFEFDDRSHIIIRDGEDFNWSDGEMNSFKIETEDLGNGKKRMRFYTEDEEPMEIEIEGGEDEVIIIDGKEIQIGGDERIWNDVNGIRVRPQGQTYILRGFEDSREAMEEAKRQMMELRERQIEIEKEYRNKMGEEQEGMRQYQRELREKERAMIDQAREIQREEMEVIKEEMRRARKEARDAREIEREYAERRADERVMLFEAAPRAENTQGIFVTRSKDVSDRIENELIRDGLIQKGESYSLKFSGDKLKINGKKQSDEVYEKYREIYESYTGTDISKSKIVIEN